MKVGLADAELDDADQTSDEVGLLVLFLQLSQDGVEAVQVVLPVLREELSDRLLVEELLHEGCLFYVFSLDLLHCRQLPRPLARVLRLGFEAVAAQCRDDALVVVLGGMGAKWAGVG